MGALYYLDRGQKSLRPKLYIYTYSSFQSFYGPGPELAKEFEKSCLCQVEFVSAGEAGIILHRMANNTNDTVDLVVGLDLLNFSEAQKIKWIPIETPTQSWSKLFLKNLSENKLNLLPYDWAPLSFIHRTHVGQRSKNHQLKSLLAENMKSKIIIQDPRTSTPGLHFLFWLTQNLTEEELIHFLKKLSSQLHSVSPSWSSSYGLFQKGQVDWVYSYSTSPIYHWAQERDYSYQALRFDEPLSVQVEFLGVPDRCRQCELAKKMAQFLLSPKAQKIIMQKNIMLPVTSGVIDNSHFLKVDQTSVIDIKNYFNWDKNKALKLWKENVVKH